jgi:hypothetical protein
VVGFASRDPDEPTPDLGSYQVYRRSGGYVGTPWLAAVPSPDGRTVAVTSSSRGAGIVPAEQVDDPTAGRWIPATAPGGPEVVWPPDGRRLLVRTSSRVRPATAELTTYLLVDARTLARRELTFGLTRPGSRSTAIRVVFGPGGKGLAFAPGVAAGEIPESGTSGGLRINGGSGGSVTLSVRPAAVPDQPFFPNGQLFASFLAGRTWVIDLASGAELGAADGEVVGWYDDDRYVVRAGTAIRLVNLADGRVLAERQLVAAGRELTGVWLAPLGGTPPPGAVVL